MCDSRQVLRNLFTVLRCHLGSAGEGQPRSSSCLPPGSTAFSNCARPPALVAGCAVSCALRMCAVPSLAAGFQALRTPILILGTIGAGDIPGGEAVPGLMPAPARPERGPRRRHPSPGCSQRPASATPTWPLTRNWGGGPQPLRTTEDSSRHLFAPLRGAGSGRSEMAAAAAGSEGHSPRRP